MDFLEEVITFKKELKEINISQEEVFEGQAELVKDQLLLIKEKILENKM